MLALTFEHLRDAGEFLARNLEAKEYEQVAIQCLNSTNDEARQSSPTQQPGSRCTDTGPHRFDLFNSNLPFVQRWIVLQAAQAVFAATVEERHYFKGLMGAEKSLSLSGSLVVLTATTRNWTCKDNPAEECAPGDNYSDAWLCLSSENGERPCDVTSYESEVSVADIFGSKIVSFGAFVSIGPPSVEIADRTVIIKSSSCEESFTFPN